MRTGNLVLVGIGVLLLGIAGKYTYSKIVGLRNNNPTNIKHSSDQWVGMSPQQTDPVFVQFNSPEYGIRAAAKNLKTYFSNGFNTIEKIIKRWAPKADNNDTQSYINAVAANLNVSPYSVLALNENTLFGLISAIIKHENGINPYSISTILNGIRMG